jgi:hypothetical protein
MRLLFNGISTQQQQRDAALHGICNTQKSRMAKERRRKNEGEELERGRTKVFMSAKLDEPDEKVTMCMRPMTCHGAEGMLTTSGG